LWWWLEKLRGQKQAMFHNKILNDIEFRRVKLTLTEKTGKY